MKILKITFRNLNSLKGEHSIDLENGLLGEAGIFAITGPTGAGKSTILDAITLALFGRAARYEKETSPSEMMTRGTGECAAEVRFACAAGCFTAKWTRARARKKSDGNLQNAKREIAKHPSGEIVAEKIKEADALIESLTGLDYHRFLRSVLLAQGRFKEFLDADENERGDLLEKITGTAIYSRISKKAFEIEREHDQAIQQARQKLDGVTLKSEEELTGLRDEENRAAASIQTLRAEFAALNSQLQRFERYQSLTETLHRSNEALLNWKNADAAFTADREKLTRHTATQPFQADLNHLSTLGNQLDDYRGETAKLTRIAALQRTAAADQLRTTEDYLRLAIAGLAQKISELETDRNTATENELTIASWLVTHETDQALEGLLPEIRALGEAARQSELRHQSLLADLRQLGEDQQNATVQHVAKKADVDRSEKILSTANAEVKVAADSFALAAETLPIETWRERAKIHAESHQASRALHSEREHWKKTGSTLAKQTDALPPLVEAHTNAIELLKIDTVRVAQETATLNDKQRLYEQSRLIATLETHRAALNPHDPCPLCGSTAHPYSTHLESDEDADKQALDAQKLILASAQKEQQRASEKTSRLDEKLKLHRKTIASTSADLEAELKLLETNALAAGYNEPLEHDDAFAAWLEKTREQSIGTDQKLAELEVLTQNHRSAQEAYSKSDLAHRVFLNQLQSLEQRLTEFAQKREKLDGLISAANQTAHAELTAFNLKLTDRLPAATRAPETASHTKTLEAISKTHQLKLGERQQLRLCIEGLNTRLQELSQTHARLLAEHQEVQDALAPFADVPSTSSVTTLSINEQETVRRRQHQEKLNTARQSAQSVAEAEKAMTVCAEAIRTSTIALEGRLGKSDFDSIESIRNARLTDGMHERINAKKIELQTQHDTLQGQLKQTQDELFSLTTAGICSDEDAIKLRSEIARIEDQIGNFNKRLGEIETLLKQDEQARVSQQGLMQEIEKLHQEARPWIELSALIGSASGDKFSKFAQGLTLAQLLDLANKHLLELSDRYQIQRTELTDLSLEIVDGYQADATRPTRSLSGGESFLVSLALALGLSDLAGSDTRIESLFIDEGFGTLDSATLDTALAALENLRMSNRTIGIISHVDALKQRISAQIRVDKSSNGYGTLEIINGG